jgi:integrase
LIAFIGDRPLAAYRRSDVRDFVDHLEKGKHTPTGKRISTTTIQRYVTTLRAAFARSIREHELPIANVWAGTIEYSKDAKGEQKRESFNTDQYKALRDGVGPLETTDDLGAMLTILAHTGARLAEVLGLRTADLHPTADIPYILIQEYDTRSTKTDYSDRKVPLTLTALQALQRAMELSNGGDYLFPRYTNATECRANSASAALGIRLRTHRITATTHGLRHGMRDLLRAAQCPEGVVSEIQGWAKTGHVAKYGSGSPLSVLSEWLNKATEVIG